MGALYPRKTIWEPAEVIADKYGTPAEQKRYDMGWLPGTERPQCANCEHMQHKGSGWHCNEGNVATQLTALCGVYERGKEL